MIDWVNVRLTDLDHDMLGAVTPFGGVKVAWKACGLAIEADINIITDRAVKAGTDDLEHAAAAQQVSGSGLFRKIGQFGRTARISRHGKVLRTDCAFQPDNSRWILR